MYAQTPEPRAEPATEAPATSGPGFDVAECQACHAETLFTNFQHSQHAKKLALSCAACHGDVAAHARMKMEGEEGIGPIFSFKRVTPQERTERCLSCHDKARQANFTGGAHERRSVDCTTCHSVHFFKSQRGQIRTVRASETCYGCHPQVRAQGCARAITPFARGLDCGAVTTRTPRQLGEC